MITLDEYTDNKSFSVQYHMELLMEKQTPYCNLKIGYNKLFGHLMFIDDEIQITSLDFAKYHDFIHLIGKMADADSVLIIGDGDGGFTHYDWEGQNVICVERDQDIMDSGKEYFGANWDRYRVVKQDANHLEYPPASFDVIVWAISDEWNRSDAMRDNLSKVMTWLKPKGRLVAQVGTVFDVNYQDVRHKYETCAESFSDHQFHHLYMPSFFSEEVFFVGVK
jgi:spermidine synthase